VKPKTKVKVKKSGDGFGDAPLEDQGRRVRVLDEGSKKGDGFG
jgi:hypothetical protein